MKTTAEQAKKTLKKRFEDAGYTAPELLEYVKMLEQENHDLAQEVKNLKLERIRKLSSHSTMSSRLKDAIRE
ncbi:hypothetical protein D3C80_1807590 [compost metagenome]